MLDLSMLPEGWVLIHSTTWNHFRLNMQRNHSCNCNSLNPLYNVEPLQIQYQNAMNEINSFESLNPLYNVEPLQIRRRLSG